MLGKSSKNIIPNGGAFNGDESHGAIRKKSPTKQIQELILVRKKNILISRVAQGVF